MATAIPTFIEQRLDLSFLSIMTPSTEAAGPQEPDLKQTQQPSTSADKPFVYHFGKAPNRFRHPGESEYIIRLEYH